MKARSYDYAGFWVRLAACALDALFFAIGAGIVGAFIAMIAAAVCVNMQLSDVAASAVDMTVDFLKDLLLTTGYWVLFTAGPWQATPGKRFFCLYVIRADGRRMGFRSSLSRYFAYGLSAAPLMIGFMMAGWTREKKALHDITCQTRVVYGRP